MKLLSCLGALFSHVFVLKGSYCQAVAPEQTELLHLLKIQAPMISSNDYQLKTHQEAVQFANTQLLGLVLESVLGHDWTSVS